MPVFESIRIATRALTANKLRSALTMLGIAIGVGAVISLVSIGHGVEKSVAEQFNSLGTNLLFVSPGPLGGSSGRGLKIKPLTYSDAQAIADRARVPDVEAVAPEWTGGVSIERNGEIVDVTVHGVTPEFMEVRNWHPTIGNFITQADVDERSRVVVLGAETYRTLFQPNEYAIDQTVRLGHLVFRVIGILEQRGGGLGGNQDEAAVIPLSTAQERLFRQKTVSGDYGVSVIYAKVTDNDRLDAAREQIASILRERHKIAYLDQDDFNIISQADMVAVSGDIVRTFTIFLGAVAGISLLVGGIGIMNIMLVSVVERTREIGIRKAVGAKGRDVLLQFVVEAVALAAVGGFCGVTIGIAGARIISRVSASLTPVVSVEIILLSLLFSLAIGLFFGIYPAYRASRMNPIDALRYE